MNIELGSFDKRPGWVTIDKDPRADMCWDLFKPLPFANNTVDQIYSSHVLEHFPYPNMMNLLKEYLRVLKPNGIFKASVPDMRIYIDAYVKDDPFEIPSKSIYHPAFHFFSKIDFVNYMAYLDGHHHFMFDKENLPLIIAHAGFREVSLRSFEPDLDLEARDHESIYVGGIK